MIGGPTVITASQYAGAVTWGSAGPGNVLFVSGDEGAYGWVNGDVGATVSSANGSTVLTAMGGSWMTSITAAKDAALFTVGNSGLASITGGGSAGAVALGGFSGTVNAGGDGVVLSEGSVNGSVTAGKDVFVLAHGDVNGGYSAGRDAAVVTYGDFNAGVWSTRDIGYVLAAGDIRGAISAGRSIGHPHGFGSGFSAVGTDAVFAYGEIDASITALNTAGTAGGGAIAGVGAGGPIDGSLFAAGPLGDVRSGDAIPASVIAANTPGIRPHESTLSSLTPPSPPASIVASLLADVATALASLHTDRADLMADLATFLSDAASARADLLTDASTAQADHFAELASLLSSTAAAVALDRAALENSLESDQATTAQAMQEAIDSINGLFVRVEPPSTRFEPIAPPGSPNRSARGIRFSPNRLLNSVVSQTST